MLRYGSITDVTEYIAWCFILQTTARVASSTKRRAKQRKVRCLPSDKVLCIAYQDCSMKLKENEDTADSVWWKWYSKNRCLLPVAGGGDCAKTPSLFATQAELFRYRFFETSSLKYYNGIHQHRQNAWTPNACWPLWRNGPAGVGLDIFHRMLRTAYISGSQILSAQKESQMNGETMQMNDVTQQKTKFGLVSN